MGFKEDLEERRQREEAKAFFRQNNDYYFSTEKWLKLIINGLGIAFGCGLLYGLFVSFVHIHFSYILIVIGVAIAKALRKISGVGNEKLGILTVVLYIFSILFSYVCASVFPLVIYNGFGMLVYLFTPAVWLGALQELFVGSIVQSLFLLMGGLYAYQVANQ